MEAVHKWDVFISHASEDKNTFVRPLAIALSQLGARVWYDEFTLEVGDSISRSIDKGLVESKYGLVVVSSAFMRKKWPEYELRGLVSREIGDEKVILPIWHGVTRDQVMAFNPSLADKLAFNTAGDNNASNIAIQILKVIRPDIYANHPRSQLEKMASGKASQELQDEMERMKKELENTQKELSQFQCPFCHAPVVEQSGIPLDPEQRHWDTLEVYECGYERIGSQTQRPCPSDPLFPKLEDYEFKLEYHPDEPVYKWSCTTQPQTDMARMFPLGYKTGMTEDEARQNVIQKYLIYVNRGKS